jgi:hypothetical protein
MNTIIRYIPLFLLLLIITFGSCKNRKFRPTLSLMSYDGYVYKDTSLNPLTPYILGVTAGIHRKSKANITSFKLTRSFDGNNTTIIDSSFNSSSFEWEKSFKTGNISGTERYTFIVKDENGYEASKTVSVKVNDFSSIIYNSSNTNLPFNEVKALKLDNSRNVWVSGLVGTDAYISYFNGTTWTNYANKNVTGLDNVVISDIEIDNLNHVWAAGNGLSYFDGTEWRLYSTTQTGLTQEIKKIAIDNDGNIWGITANYAFKYNGTTWEEIDLVGLYNFSSNLMQDVFVDKNNNVWILARHNLAKFNGSSWVIYRGSTSTTFLDNNNLTHFAANKNGELFIGAATGMAHFNGSTWQTLGDNVNDSVSIKNIQAMAFDINDNLWVGMTNLYGTAVYNGAGWTKELYDGVNGAGSSSGFNAFDQNPSNGDKWIGFSSGVLYWKNE